MVEIHVKTMISLFLFNQTDMIQIASGIGESTPPLTRHGSRQQLASGKAEITPCGSSLRVEGEAKSSRRVWLDVGLLRVATMARVCHRPSVSEALSALRSMRILCH